MRVDERFLPFVVTLDGLSTTFLLVLPQLMIVDESWQKLSWEATLINSRPRLVGPGFIYQGYELLILLLVILEGPRNGVRLRTGDFMVKSFVLLGFHCILYLLHFSSVNSRV